jgi:hypothetical protein
VYKTLPQKYRDAGQFIPGFWEQVGDDGADYLLFKQWIETRVSTESKEQLRTVAFVGLYPMIAQAWELNFDDIRKVYSSPDVLDGWLAISQALVKEPDLTVDDEFAVRDDQRREYDFAGIGPYIEPLVQKYGISTKAAPDGGALAVVQSTERNEPQQPRADDGTRLTDVEVDQYFEYLAAIRRSLDRGSLSKSNNSAIQWARDRLRDNASSAVRARFADQARGVEGGAIVTNFIAFDPNGALATTQPTRPSPTSRWEKVRENVMAIEIMRAVGSLFPQIKDTLANVGLLNNVAMALRATKQSEYSYASIKKDTIARIADLLQEAGREKLLNSVMPDPLGSTVEETWPDWPSMDDDTGQ